MLTLQDDSVERAHTTNKNGKRLRLNPLFSPMHEKQDQGDFVDKTTNVSINLKIESAGG